MLSHAIDDKNRFQDCGGYDGEQGLGLGDPYASRSPQPSPEPTHHSEGTLSQKGRDKTEGRDDRPPRIVSPSFTSRSKAGFPSGDGCIDRRRSTGLFFSTSQKNGEKKQMNTQPTHAPLAQLLGSTLTRKELADSIMLDDVHYAFTVRAVNSHQELMTIVRKLHECFETGVDKATIYASGFSDLNPSNPDETWNEAVERIIKAEGK
jgi:hypothetical protein